jgi:LPPG:FO 2-phospho-L-lactate transferase
VTTPRYVVLSGGVGGAKLALGLSRILNDDNLSILANTGDDFTHLGLSISPDIDTLMYTLADEVNPETGWGRRDETWNFMTALQSLNGETWFRLGDRDLATHIERTRQLAAGSDLTRVTAQLCTQLAVATPILPMSNDPVRTTVITDRGSLAFQHYFVRDAAKPQVNAIEYSGAAAAEPTPEVLAAIGDPELAGIIIAPSNPWLSINPLLAIPALRRAIADSPAPVIAVSPIIGDRAVKGPTAKIMRELALPVSAISIAEHYRGILDGFVLDETDRNMVASIESLDLRVQVCDTMMTSIDHKIRVAQSVVNFIEALH